MYPTLEQELVRQHAIEARRSAAGRRLVRQARSEQRSIPATVAPTGDIAIREAEAGDVLSLIRLSEIDSHPLPSGRILVAEVDGQVRAAYAIESGESIADPFMPTDPLVALLALRARQVEPFGSGARRRGVFGLFTARPGRAA